MKLCGRDFAPDLLQRIQSAIDAEPAISRRALSLRVCDWLGWKARTGKPKDMSCRVALLRLHRSEWITLPAVKTNASVFRPRPRPDVAVEMAEFSGSLVELGEVEVVPVDSGNRELSALWNAMMALHHYLGGGPLCGAQIRYLIKSPKYGWLGGLSFSAAAWRVAARDRWIGWSDASRRENLAQVVCNSRFLIGPTVRVPHLASHVLSRCIKRLDHDWQARYGYKPALLETYVEQERFRGTCYRAANWQRVGQTRGRGRQDRDQARAKPVKDVYLYPLRAQVQTLLCAQSAPASAPMPAKTPAADWAEEEFGQVDLGDERLNRRVVSIARDFYARPQGSIPQACQTRAKTKAAYRLFEHPAAHMDSLLTPHYSATIARCQTQSVVLAAQDTTALNYSAHPATEKLGHIGSRQDGPIGLVVHDTMAFTPEGVPLGLLDVQCWARDPEEFGKKEKRHSLPIEQKESNKWLRSYEKVAAAQRLSPNTLFVSVGDREADIYELFALAKSQPAGPKLLVRAERDRALADGQERLWEHMQNVEVAGIQEIHIPRQRNRAARTAQLAVRFAAIELKPPRRKEKLAPLRIWAVLASETNTPEKIEPLEWMLLTTCPVADFPQAVEKLDWYAKRWGIEVYHRTLKSGCLIEERQLGHAERIEACLAVDMVVAWRIHHLTKLGRETPDVPCTVFFEEAEWKALLAYIKQDPVAPEHPPTLREATRMVARLGGFLGRKCDGEPGTKSLWIGLQRLDDIAGMWTVMVRHIQSRAMPP